MSDFEENSYFCFPLSPDVSLDFVSGNIRTLGIIKLPVVIFLDFHFNVLQQQQKNTLKWSESKQFTQYL